MKSHIKNLRQKVEAGKGKRRIIETAPVGGYRLGLSRDP